MGGTPAQVRWVYALRSPDHYADAIARSRVPLQIYWSPRDQVIRDQYREAGALAEDIRDDGDHRLWEFEGDWLHTAEMQPTRRLPRALARFGLLPWQDAPRIVPGHPPLSTLRPGRRRG